MSTTATTPKPMMKGRALETARAENIAPRGTVNASIEVCTSIARSTLARVLLNTHVMTIVNVMAVRVKSVMPMMPPPPEEVA
jgi:hypothetical protein